MRKLIGQFFYFHLFAFAATLLVPSARAVVLQSGSAPNSCLDTPGAAAIAGAQLQVAACNAGESQQFTIANGAIRFRGLCLDAWGGRGNVGDPVKLWYCVGTPNQIWGQSASGDIRGIAGKCLGVEKSNVVLAACDGGAAQRWTSLNLPPPPCSVAQVSPAVHGGLTVWSPDGTKYLVNKEDANGIAQIYVGQRQDSAPICITCAERPNGPKANKFKMQPHWHPSGRWILLAVEQDSFEKPLLATPDLIEGWLQSGIWVDMYATTPDGTIWHKLQDFSGPSRARGFSGVAFTPSGDKGVWAQIVEGSIFAYTFGKWELILADFEERNGVPSFTNLRNITPPDTYWVEPGNFSPNGKDLVMTADTGFPDHSRVEGQDQFILDIYTGQVTNLTKTPGVWDEHGRFSPDGEKILFMSSYPFRSDPMFSTVLFLKTEFMMMDKDGTNLRQVSHFNQPGFPEYSFWGGVAANGEWNPDGRSASVLSLIFPNYKSWTVSFAGACGKQY